ncbi:MAG: hypothetical protein IGS03_06900 [Candidatus Sericytochromatia bacterium]|nr:hypothetical protein [Candidatus Sericytochromatia bacterium]
MLHVQNLVFLSDSVMYEHLRQVQPGLFEQDNAYLLLDIDVAALLPADARYFYLQDLTCHENQHLPFLLDFRDWLNGLYPELKALTHRGVSIWESVSASFFYPYRAIILAIQGLKQLSERLTWAHFYLTAPLKHPVYLDTGGLFESDGIQAAMAFWALQQDIRVHWLNPPDKTDDSNHYIRHIVSETNLGQTALVPLTPPESLNRLVAQPPKKCVILIGNSSDCHDIPLLTDYLKQSPDYFFIYLSTQHFFRYEEGPGYLALDFRYLYAWPWFTQAQYDQISESVRRALQNPNPVDKASYDYLLNNPFLAFQQDWLYNSCLEIYKVIEVAHYLQQTLAPAVCMFGYGHITKTVAAFINTMRSGGTRLMHVVHGGYMAKDTFADLPPADYALVRGQQFAAQLSKDKVSRDCFVVGDLRKESAVLEQKRPKHSPAQGKQPPKIMYLTNRLLLGTGVGKVADFSLLKHYETLQGIFALAERRKDLQFIWKPHPRHDYVHYYARQDHTVIPFYGREQSLAELLEDVSVCVLLNNFSASMIEAAVSETPIIQLRTAFTDSLSLNTAYLAPDIHVVHSLEALEQQIDLILSDGSARERNVCSVIQTKEKWCEAVGTQALDNTLKAFSQIDWSLPEVTLPSAEIQSGLGHIVQLMAWRAAYARTRDRQQYQRQRQTLLEAFTAPEDRQLVARYIQDSEKWI